LDPYKGGATKILLKTNRHSNTKTYKPYIYIYCLDTEKKFSVEKYHFFFFFFKSSVVKPTMHLGVDFKKTFVAHATNTSSLNTGCKSDVQSAREPFSTKLIAKWKSDYNI
jgi:hypothetical protein